MFEEEAAENLFLGSRGRQEGFRGGGRVTSVPGWGGIPRASEVQVTEAGRGRERGGIVVGGPEQLTGSKLPRSGVGRGWLSLWVTQALGLSRGGRGRVAAGAEFNLI